MSRKKIEESVYRHAEELLEEKGYISPVELLVKMGQLNQKNVEDWRFKRVSYLEHVIDGNLRKLNHILKSLKKYAESKKLPPSITLYKSWGKGKKQDLRFSKSANSNLEKLYSTHYVLPSEE